MPHFFGSEPAGSGGQGGGVAEVRNGQKTAKKQAHSLREGTAREDNTLGSVAMGMGTAAQEGGSIVPGGCDWDSFFWMEGGGL